jgi:hypothetical protein
MRTTYAVAALLALGAAHAARADEAPATPTTTFSGKAFVDLSYRQNVDNGTDKAVPGSGGNGTALDLKRFYLGVDHAFDGVWSARIRTDVGNEVNGKYDVFVKHAFVQAQVAPELAIRAGSADLPWVPFVEDLYGFRYVENVLIDRTKFGTSADWGVHAGGKLGGGLASYAVSAVNGRGYGDPTRTQAPTVEGRVSLAPVTGLTLGVGGQAGKLGQNVVGTATPHTAERVDAVAAFVSSDFRLGATGFVAKNYAKNIVTGAAPEDKAVGASAWASFTVLPPVSIFGRADYVQPQKDTKPDLKDMYVNAGIQVKPAKPIDIALVYKYEQVKNGTLATSNGTIGSTVPGEKGTYSELGVFAQYSF